MRCNNCDNGIDGRCKVLGEQIEDCGKFAPIPETNQHVDREIDVQAEPDTDHLHSAAYLLAINGYGEGDGR